ncbi:hypothetical protein ACMFMF_006078 [Clarireedia jacksonii]
MDNMESFIDIHLMTNALWQTHGKRMANALWQTHGKRMANALWQTHDKRIANAFVCGDSFDLTAPNTFQQNRFPTQSSPPLAPPARLPSACTNAAGIHPTLTNLFYH